LKDRKIVSRSIRWVYPTFVTLTLFWYAKGFKPSPKAGEGLPIRLPFSLFWEKGLGDEGKLA
jgi:hypothetical protein